MNPNFDELLADLRLLWKRWDAEEQQLRDDNLQSKASTKRMCMEDIERIVEKYSDSVVDVKSMGSLLVYHWTECSTCGNDVQSHQLNDDDMCRECVTSFKSLDDHRIGGHGPRY